MKSYNKLLKLIRCLNWESDLKLEDKVFSCTNCNKKYPILNGIPRFVDESFYKLNDDNTDIEKKTKNYFGFEWSHFKDWGFIDDKNLSAEEKSNYFGGTIENRKNTFLSKCRLVDDDIASKIVLDAGCGNGRYTFEAATKNKNGLVIGVDIGYGSVSSAYENTAKLKNVIIIQGSLFNLPFKNEVLDSVFSNGVLMHTGNAKRAFGEICRTIKVGGVFVAHLYGKLNPIWEFNDWFLRKITTRLSINSVMKFSIFLSKLCRIICRTPRSFEIFNLFFRIQPSVIHMFDWYSAPIATHHTYTELAKWFLENNFKLEQGIKKKLEIDKKIFFKPWAINLKGTKIKKIFN